MFTGSTSIWWIIYFWTYACQLFIHSAQAAFIAYDWGGTHLNITSFDSLEVREYVIPKTTEIERIQRIKLLQNVETYSIYYQACYSLVDYLITLCSAFEDAQMVGSGFYSELMELGHNRCQDIHQHCVFHSP